jgi:hypothetical protein
LHMSVICVPSENRRFRSYFASFAPYLFPSRDSLGCPPYRILTLTGALKRALLKLRFGATSTDVCTQYVTPLISLWKKRRNENISGGRNSVNFRVRACRCPETHLGCVPSSILDPFRDRVAFARRLAVRSTLRLLPQQPPHFPATVATAARSAAPCRRWGCRCCC